MRSISGGIDVVDEDVGAGDELLENLEALGGRDIERDAELVGVEVEEQARIFPDAGRPSGNGPRVRARSPTPGRSILITSAPMSAISLEAYGAATSSPSSTIFTSESAPAICSLLFPFPTNCLPSFCPSPSYGEGAASAPG